MHKHYNNLRRIQVAQSLLFHSNPNMLGEALGTILNNAHFSYTLELVTPFYLCLLTTKNTYGNMVK